MKSKTLGWVMAGIVVPAISLLVVGCASTPDTATTVAADQDKALKDPMGYSPTMDNTDISGGNFGSYDNNAMMKDLNDIFNP